MERGDDNDDDDDVDDDVGNMVERCGVQISLLSRHASFIEK